jgi:hypothetical protein
MTSNGFAILLSVESESTDQMAFESTGGNLDVMGLAEFVEIRPNCTEVMLALHCQIKNRLFAWLDRRFHFMEAFVTSELRSIRAAASKQFAATPSPFPTFR